MREIRYKSRFKAQLRKVSKWQGFNQHVFKYVKTDDYLELIMVDIGSHSSLFKK